jgi:hypothetical protein
VSGHSRQPIELGSKLGQAVLRLAQGVPRASSTPAHVKAAAAHAQELK